MEKPFINPPGKQRIPSLDGIRAICILMVLGAHASHTDGFPQEWLSVTPYLINGSLGVQVFFVLSGFVITYLLAREGQVFGAISLSEFYIRRVLRIFPVYYCFFIVFLLVTMLIGEGPSLCQSVTILTFTKNYGCGSWLDGHLWSLSVEEQFYLLWPALLAFVPPKRLHCLALGLVLSAPVFRVGFYLLQETGLLRYSFFTNMDSLIIGGIVGFAYQRQYPWLFRWLRFAKTVIRLLAIGMIYLVWMAQQHFWMPPLVLPLGSLLQSVASAYLIVSYAGERTGVVFRFLNTAPIVSVGVLSYSIYIWQQLILVPSGFYGDYSAFFLSFPINLVACVIVAWFSYNIVEKRFIALRAKHRRSDINPANVHDWATGADRGLSAVREIT